MLEKLLQNNRLPKRVLLSLPKPQTVVPKPFAGLYLNQIVLQLRSAISNLPTELKKPFKAKNFASVFLFLDFVCSAIGFPVFHAIQ